jgi:hypothetical protein
MDAIMVIGLGLELLTATPAPPQPATERAISNYGLVLAGRRQLSELSLQERLELIELGRQLRSQQEGGPSETRQDCKDRLTSDTPSSLEGALVDLKCSQRPSKPAG